MISAERFAQESGSYWRAVFPKMEHFVRFSNGVASRYAPAAVFQSDPNRHIVISEAAYVRWLWHLRGEADDVDRSFEVASKRLAVVWDQGDFAPGLEDVEREDVDAIFQNMVALRGWSGLAGIVGEPRLPGCGVISGGSPDFFGSLAGEKRTVQMVGEFKTVKRSFRSVDYRQLVVYLVLQWAATKELLDVLWLVNPLQGTLVPIDVDSFFWLTRSQSADEAVAELASEWASPGVSN